jgi:uncharacterized protein YqfA (UPF0365 family)
MSLHLFAQAGRKAAEKAPTEGGSPFESPWVWVVIAFVVLLFLLMMVVLLQFVRLWVQSFLTRAQIGILDLLGMKFRNVDYAMIVRQKIALVKSDLTDIPTRKLEAHYLSRGNVPKTVTALIAARKAGFDLNWDRAAAIDLAGRDILDAVRTSVNPKVIDCPDPTKGRQTVDGVAKDGIQLKAKARVTVRTNIERLVGGATEETIIARVGEGIVTTIGSAESHKIVLENPDMISKRVLEKGLDSGTAFEILSIDIADIDVGDNIGANLQATQAEADTRVARAKAEETRAFAVAREQEMLALIQENRAKVVLSEAEIPLALADAMRQGNLGVADYYHLKNLQADTDMRMSIAGNATGHALSPRRES